MKKMLFAAVMAALLSVAVFADIAPGPGKSPNRVKKPVVVDTQMDIRLDGTATEARLLVPASQIKQLRAELEALDNGADTAAFGGADSTLKVQTVISALFLSLAFVFGGLWLAKNRRFAIKAKAFGAVALLSVIGSAATLVYANAGPPAEARSITGKMFSQSMHIYGFGWGKVKLELTNENRIQLIVPNPKTEAKPAGDE
jgi:hypothetical protein